MDDFCVPLNLEFGLEFRDLDFRDKYAVEEFLSALGTKEKILGDKRTLLNSAAELARDLQWIAQLDDPLETEMPFHYLHVGVDQSFAKIKKHFDSITELMRQGIASGIYGLERDLALCEKAFARVKQIRGIA